MKMTIIYRLKCRCIAVLLQGSSITWHVYLHPVLSIVLFFISASEEEDRRFRKRPRKQRNKQNKANLSETQGGETRAKVQRNLPSDLTKNQKRKLKKKRRKEKMKQEVSGSTNTEFVYVGSSKETEQVVVDTG